MIETKLFRKEGSLVSVEVHGSAEFTEFGRYLGMQGTTREITRRKLVEEELYRQIQEKDRLLQEVHHRVKNNLNVIVSLLNL